MSRQARLPIPRSAAAGRFADIQETFPLSTAEEKRLDAFLKAFSQSKAMKELKPQVADQKAATNLKVVARSPATRGTIVSRRKAKVNGSNTRSKG